MFVCFFVSLCVSLSIARVSSSFQVDQVDRVAELADLLGGVRAAAAPPNRDAPPAAAPPPAPAAPPAGGAAVGGAAEAGGEWDDGDDDEEGGGGAQGDAAQGTGGFWGNLLY